VVALGICVMLGFNLGLVPQQPKTATEAASKRTEACQAECGGNCIWVWANSMRRWQQQLQGQETAGALGEGQAVPSGCKVSLPLSSSILLIALLCGWCCSLYVRLCSCSLLVVCLISFLLMLYGLLHVWLTIVRCMASRFAHCLLYVCLSLTLSCSLLAVWLLLLAAIAKLLDVAVAALLADLPLLLLLAALLLLLSLINC
jgi:hypothetical protein